MYLTPVPGCDRGQLTDTLQHVQTSLINVRGQTSLSGEVLRFYSMWAAEAVRQLRGKVRDHDLDRLVLTRRYWALQAATASTDTGLIVDIEIDERRLDFDAAIRELEAERGRENNRPGHVVVPDTNVFIEHPDKLESIDFAGQLGLREQPVRLMIPLVVIDELDGLKSKGGRSQHIRWRAAYTLAFLEKHLDRTGHGGIRDADFSPLDSGGIPRGRITVEVVMDPPGHVRLPISDDEIVDRALSIQALIGRSVTVVTYDTGMALRARTAGLRVEKLAVAPGPEPSRE